MLRAPAVALLLAAAVVVPATAQLAPRPPRAFSVTTERTTWPVRRLAPGVYAVPGDSGKGVEGRPNAGFVVTPAGVVVVGGVASPAQGRALIRTIRTVTRARITHLVLYAHHPDMHFGAIAFRTLGARIVAHPDRRVLAGEAGDDAMLAGWAPVVGLTEMLGFEFADTPDLPVTGTDTLVVGGRRLVLWHPGTAHSPGDLLLWVPDAGVLFTGDVVVEDGVTMVVDGGSAALLEAYDGIEALHPRVLVPGHGRIPADPAGLLARSRTYMETLRQAMRRAVEQGTPMRRALADLPPVDEDRPVSLNSRLRRNAARVYTEMEREVMGLPGNDQ